MELTTTAEHQVREWSEREPWRMASFLATAGGAALLVPSAYPVFPSPDAGRDGQGTDFSALDFSKLSWDFSGFAGLDGVLAGLDAGIDAGTASADGSGAD